MSRLIKAAALLDKDTIYEIMLKVAPPNNPGNCMTGIFNIYYIVYANYIIAMGTDFFNPEHQRICDAVRKRSKEILDFFETTYHMLKSQRDSGFMKWANWMGESADTTIEDEFFTSEDILLQAGFRKIDLNLWLACIKFDFIQAKKLLDSGANPNLQIPMYINIEDLPLPKDYISKFETESISLRVSGFSNDFIDCYDGFSYWDSAINGRNIVVNESYIPNLITSAAYHILNNLLLPYSNNFQEQDSL